MAKDASAGNRTRAARVAGEHSTTEPPMRILTVINSPCYNRIKQTNDKKRAPVTSQVTDKESLLRCSLERVETLCTLILFLLRAPTPTTFTKIAIIEIL